MDEVYLFENFTTLKNFVITLITPCKPSLITPNKPLIKP